MKKDVTRMEADTARLRSEVNKLGEQLEQAQAYGQSLQDSNAKLMRDNQENAAHMTSMLQEKAKLAEEFGSLKGSYSAVTMQLENATTKTIPDLEIPGAQSLVGPHQVPPQGDDESEGDLGDGVGIRLPGVGDVDP